MGSFGYLKLMLDTVQQSGKIAMDFFADSRPTLKPDNSVLTRADTAISKFIRKSLKDILNSPDHRLIDEEDLSFKSIPSQTEFEKIPYLWVIDPIDGTKGFSNQMPTFGISIGVLKELKPWLGVVYLPLLKELFYCDGEKSFFVQNAFSQEEVKREITHVDQKITKQSLFFSYETFLKKYDWDPAFCSLMLVNCAVIDLCYPAIGRGCGATFKAHLWDFAGSWPIFLSAGLKLRALESGKVLERLNVGDFAFRPHDPWRLKEEYILSSERNFVILKEKIKLRMEKQT